MSQDSTTQEIVAEQPFDPAARLAFIAQPGGPFAESMRSIRANLATLLDGNGARISILSPWVDDGKSLVAANVAVALAQIGRSVLLVDGDLRRPTLSHYFQVTHAPGFSDMLEKGTPLLETIVKTTVPGFHFLPAGTCKDHPSNLLASPAVSTVTMELQNSAHFVVFDSPPLTVCSDGFLMARATDASILVVNQRSWRGEPESKIKRQLEEGGVNILGVILNETDPGPESGISGYHTYYYYRKHPSV